MTLDVQHFKDLLSKEVLLLEKELETLGRKNPDHPADWEAVETNVDEDSADEGEIAEGIETYENNNAELGDLEIQLNAVKSALSKIEKDTYGKCEICSETIEMDRLEANPSAKTCKAHMS